MRSVACMWWMGYYSLPRPTALKPRYEPRAWSTELQSYLLATIQLSSFSTWKPECKLLFIVNLLSVLNHILLPTTLLWLCDNICLLLLFWHITWISALHISSLTTNTTIVRSCLYHCHARYLFKDIRNTMPVQPIFCHYRDYLIDIEYWYQLYDN